MYFTGNLKVDPSEATKIEAVEPSGVFKKLLSKLGGGFNKKVEIETFTAVSIIQQLYRVLKALKINNVLKLSHDDEVIYEDTSDNQNDLDLVVMQYELETNEIYSKDFKLLTMTLEHELDDMKYLVKVTVNKHHDVGVYPIEINVKGLNLIDKFRSCDQQEIKDLLKKRGEKFVNFLNQIDFQFRRLIAVDDIKVEHDVNLVIDQQDIETLKSEKERSSSTNFTLESLLRDVGMEVIPSKLTGSKSLEKFFNKAWDSNHFEFEQTTIKKTSTSYSSEKIVVTSQPDKEIKEHKSIKELTIPLNIEIFKR